MGFNSGFKELNQDSGESQFGGRVQRSGIWEELSTLPIYLTFRSGFATAWDA